MNRTNIYVRYQDKQCKMQHYSTAHRIVRFIYNSLILSILLLMLATILAIILFINNITSIIPLFITLLSKMSNQDFQIQEIIKDSMAIARQLVVNGIIFIFLITLFSSILLAMPYMFLLKEIIMFLLCFMSIIDLLNEIKQNHISKTPRVIDITENTGNLIMGFMLIKILFMPIYTAYFKKENVQSTEIYNFIVLIIMRWLIGKIFNITYDLFDIKLEEFSDPIKITEHDQLETE